MATELLCHACHTAPGVATDEQGRVVCKSCCTPVETVPMAQVLTLDRYQLEAAKTITYDERHTLTYLALAINGEAGEVAEKVKKILRDKSGVVSEEDRQALKLELGDCCWYIAALAGHLGFTLGEVCQANLVKLADRQRRGVLKGSGDTR